MKLKNGYLVRKVKKTSRRKKWLSLILFIVILLPIFWQLFVFFASSSSKAAKEQAEIVKQQIQEYTNEGLSEEEAYGRYKEEYISNYVANSEDVKPSYVAQYKNEGLTDEEAEKKYNLFVVEQAEKAYVNIEGVLKNPATLGSEFFDPTWLFAFSAAAVYFTIIFWTSKRQFKKPYTHKVFRNLKFGKGQLENLQQFEEEMTARNIPEYGHALITDHWLFYDGWLRIKLRNISEVVCVCKVRTRSKSFLTRWASRKKDVIIGFADKSQWVIKLGKEYSYVDEFIDLMEAKIPYIIINDEDASVFRTWYNNPDEIIKQFEESRYHYKNAKQIEENKIKTKKENERRSKIVKKATPKLAIAEEDEAEEKNDAPKLSMPFVEEE